PIAGPAESRHHLRRVNAYDDAWPRSHRDHSPVRRAHVPDYLEKLRPDQDLQCYFLRPSAIAALSEATPTSFKVSGTWRQQFDWCVVEWNQHNVFEHPAFRNLPNGNFTGYTLTYE